MRVVVVLVALLLLPVVAVGQEEFVVPAEVYPAPVGYSVVYFAEPYFTKIEGFRSEEDYYFPYRARVSSGTLVLVEDYRMFDYIVSVEGTGVVHRIESELLDEGYVFEVDGRRYAAFGSGRLYYSSYDIYFGYTPPNASAYVLVAYEYEVDFSVEGVRALFYPGTGDVVITTSDGARISTSLERLLGISDACVVWFEDEVGPFTGGLLISPACTRNVEVLKTVEYGGRPYAVVVAARTPYGVIDYLVFAYYSTWSLVETGILHEIDMPDYYHIYPLDVDGHFYTSPDYYDYPTRLPDIGVVEDVSESITDSWKRVCVLPENANITYTLLWRHRPVAGTVYLDPGELVLFEWNDRMMACMGEMDWAERFASIFWKASEWRELKTDITLYSTNNEPFLVVAANGSLWYGAEMVIPWSVYEENTIFLFTRSHSEQLYIPQRSIFTSLPFVFITLVVFGLVAHMLATKSETRETIRVLLDLPTPAEVELADPATLKSIAGRHVDAFGVCPSIYDLAIYHGILAPLPDNAKPEDELLYCPFRANEESERVLRRLARALLGVFWAVKRTGRDSGIIFTLVGETMPTVYWTQYTGGSLAEYIVRSIEKAYKTRYHTPYNMVPVGLALVVPPAVAGRARELVAQMRELGAGSIDVDAFAKAYGVVPRVGVEKLQKFIDEKLRGNIVVVSDELLGDFLEWLSEQYLAYSAPYYARVDRWMLGSDW